MQKEIFSHPKSLFTLAFIELFERFAFYALQALLVLFMVDKNALAYEVSKAAAITGVFIALIYLLSLFGGFIADKITGLIHAIFLACILITLGHFFIAFSYFYVNFFFLGLIFLCFGTALFKPCSMLLVGKLYKKSDKRIDFAYMIFYMCINIGAVLAPLISGFLASFNWHLGFLSAGLAMMISLFLSFFKLKNIIIYDESLKLKTNFKNLFFIFSLLIFLIFLIFFALNFINVNLIFLSKYLIFFIIFLVILYFFYYIFLSKLSKFDKSKLAIIAFLFIFISFFWAAFAQFPITFNLFANFFTDKNIFNIEIPSSYFQSLNPFFIIVLTPFLTHLWLKLSKSNFNFSSLAKFSFGFFLCAFGFFIMFLAALSLNETGKVSMLFIIFSVFFISLGELFISPVGFSLISKNAPNCVATQLMSIWFVSLSLGNLIAGLLGGQISEENAANLPYIFILCATILAILGLVLLIFKAKISKLIS